MRSSMPMTERGRRNPVRDSGRWRAGGAHATDEAALIDAIVGFGDAAGAGCQIERRGNRRDAADQIRQRLRPIRRRV